MAKEFITIDRLALFYNELKKKIKSYLSDNNYITDSNYVHTDSNYTTTEKAKLEGIATGAEVNQNAFSNITIGSTIVAADSKTDTLTLAGSNVTLTPDATNDKITIGITKGNVTNALGYIPANSATNATTSAAGLMSAADKAKLDGIAEKVNNYTLPSATSTTLGGVKIGSNLSVTADGTISATSLEWANVKNHPTKLSEFTNDTKYITEAELGLSNYYKKTETYSQTEINDMISKITSISIQVVTELPAKGTNGVVYLMAHSHASNDSYDEYIWVESNSAYEKIGNTDVDLTGYWTTAALTEATEQEILNLFS